MKLRTLIEAILPTLLDEMEEYDDLELSLIALDSRREEIASSIMNIKRASPNNYIITSSEVHIGSTSESSPSTTP